MFVSSYSTYISTDTTQRAQKDRTESAKTKESSFANSLNSDSKQALQSTLTSKLQLPLNYISDYKVLNNQQKLQQENLKEQVTAKFTQISTLQNAKVAYADNSKMFSLFQKPKVTLNQTAKLSVNIPQEAQEKSLRNVMINTYIANENYYKITA